MFVLLASSFTNAQTFGFDCISRAEILEALTVINKVHVTVSDDDITVNIQLFGFTDFTDFTVLKNGGPEAYTLTDIPDEDWPTVLANVENIVDKYLSRLIRKAAIEDLGNTEAYALFSVQPGSGGNQDSSITTIFSRSLDGSIGFSGNPIVTPSYIEDWDESVFQAHLLIIGSRLRSALATIRTQRLDYIDNVIADNEVTIVVTKDGFDDLYTVSFDGAGENGSEAWSRTTTSTAIENIAHTPSSDLSDLLVELNDLANEAQTEYDARLGLVANQEQLAAAADANDLSDQTQDEADALSEDDRRAYRTAELNNLVTSSPIYVLPQWDAQRQTHKISITIHTNILETFYAYDYVTADPVHGALDQMTVVEFNNYYNACWIFIDNNL